MIVNGEIIAKELKGLRTKNNLTQKQLADILGIHENTIRKYETNATDLSLELFHKWLDHFDIDEIVFFNIVREYNHSK